MKSIYTPGYLIFIIVVSSCSNLRKTPKSTFINGFYIQKTNNDKKIVYVTIEDEVLHIQPIVKDTNILVVDTAAGGRFYPKEKQDGSEQSTSFNQYSFDIDVLTIPLKFRPGQKGIPLQLNTNLNGAVYVGYRTDRFNVLYAADPLKKMQRNINHYGFSMGGFTGIGNTAMTPTTTDNNITIEYDGVVWTKGIAGIIAINDFTIGISIGFDNLLDTNRKRWIYEKKTWFGLAFGLNLN